MELVTKKRLQLFSGRSHTPLAEEIAAHLDVELGEANLSQFANGELHCRFGESIRGSDVFILQTHSRPVNEAVMEQLIMIDAAKRASAKRITAVCPFYIVSVDLHSGQIQGFFDGPVDHLTAMPVLVDYLHREVDGDLTIVSPDAGRINVAERFSQHLDADLAFVYKRRRKDVHNVVEAREVIGDVDGRHCVIVDDMIDTASTLCAAAEILTERGATCVWAMATHGVLSDPATDRLKNSSIERVVITNTLPLPPEKQIDKIEVLSVAKIIADAVDAVFEDTSVSEIFGGDNLS